MINLLLLGALIAGAPAEPSYSLGLVSTTPAQFAQSSRIKLRATRDVSARPKHLVLEDYLPPVGNQASQGSCVGWSTAYYAYTYAVAKQRGIEKPMLSTPKWQFSPAFIFHQRDKMESKGMSIYRAMKILEEKGCATLTEMPYDEHDPTSAPPPTAFQRAEKFKALKTGVVFFHFADPNSPSAKTIPQNFEPEKVKQLLYELRQPLVISIPVYEDFQTADANAVYDHTGSAEPLGGHAIAIIGYDEDKKAFRMINSWTDQWGDKGQLWLSEDWLRREAREGWIFIAGGGWARKKPGETDRPGENWAAVLDVLPPVSQKGTK